MTKATKDPGDAYMRVETPRASITKAPLDEVKASSLPNPLDSANWLSRVTLWWVNPLIRKGYASTLLEDDVWRLPRVDASAVLQQSFDHYYQEEKAKHVHADKRDAPTSIVKPLWYSTRNKMALAIVLHLVSAGFSVLQPLLIKSVLLFLQGKDNFFGIESGYTLAALLVVATFIGVSTLDYGMYLTTRAGLNARMIAVNSVYQKILKLTTTARQSMNSGDIITLAGVDSDRLFEAYAIGMWTIVSPTMVVAVCILIGVEMGWYVALVAAVCCVCILVYAMNNSRNIGLCRRKILAIAGERVKVTNEVLQGIRVIKMYAWEDSITERVREIREREIAVIRKYDYLRANNMVVLSLAQTFMVAMCFFVYVYQGNTIDVPTAFTLLAFANVCRMPFGIFSNAVVFASEAIASMQRISKFLAADEIEINLNQDVRFHDDSAVIEIRDGDFSWGKAADSISKFIEAEEAQQGNEKSTSTEDSQQHLILSNINLSIPAGSLTIVVGAVGSGKTSLMNALLGEMHQNRGTCAVKGSIAYASQQAWIQHNTVRENILFGMPFNQKYYDEVIAACQLERDLEILENGDATEIGERGINLSGGQKARVSIARVMYRRNADVMILDDPLSALDVHVANSVFFQCVLGLVKEKTRVLVLNSHYHLLRHADRIIMLADGQVVGDGTYDEVKSTFAFLEDQSHSKVAGSIEAATDDASIETDDALLKTTAVVQLDDDVEEESNLLTDATYDEVRDSIAYSETPETMERLSLSRVSGATSTVSKRRTKSSIKKDAKKEIKSMMLQEDRQKGKMGWRIYADFFATSGYNGTLLAFLVLIVFAIGQGALLGSDYWVTYWSNGSMNNTFSQKTLLWLYLAIVVCATLLSVFRAILFTEICIRCSKALHSLYFRLVLHAPVTTFFDVTPVGQILNRFSRDLDQIDNPLAYYAMGFLMFGMTTLSIFIVCAVTTPYTLILYAPLFGACYYIQKYFQTSARELKRLDGVTRSPFLNLVAETINGIESIRSFQMTDKFSVRCSELLDHNGKFFFMFQSSSKWFALRLDWLVATVVSMVSFTCIASRDSIGPASAGIALTYAIQLTMQFQRLLTLGTMTENFMTSFERISYYKNLEEEGSKREIVTTPAASWPTQGTITFENVSLRYRDGLDLVLKNVSFAINDGEKIGVCGRTGSGKSTLMSALFRVVECAEGRILIDGVDISTIKIQDLRKKLTIIPQDPVLFSGSLRLNLDPFDEKPDDDVWHVLRKVHLFDDVSKWGQGLEYEVAEKGDNLSVGQRQLVCIARALLRQSRIIVLDEATANVDQELDRMIQVAVKENFQDKTAMTIAHRLETIADSDRILVLDHGVVQEFDSPANLLAKPDGMFASLINSTKDH
uniref:Uncharacterized protein n=1 Tax=Globisporangium ultimum (strain ATCC 200006 / CBS 805.95 / DAOM BR144) TaxID=431595 RepID=K3WIN5_GLOUD